MYRRAGRAGLKSAHITWAYWNEGPQNNVPPN
jgi:hypothetical protein